MPTKRKQQTPKRKQLAGLGIKKPPSPTSQNTGNTLNKVRQSKNKQATIRLAANIVRHGGQAKNATIKPKIVGNTKGKASPPAPITLQGLQRVRLASIHVTWLMGIAQYTTQATSLVGYIVRQSTSFAWVYCPASQAKPAQYYCASLAPNGLTQWAIIYWFAPPNKPKTGKPSPTGKPSKPVVKPKQRARHKPPTNWGIGQSKPISKPKKATSKPSKPSKPSKAT